MSKSQWPCMSFTSYVHVLLIIVTAFGYLLSSHKVDGSGSLLDNSTLIANFMLTTYCYFFCKYLVSNGI